MFNYNNAFSRNIGWLTKQEQLILKSKRVAVAGCGGVGGEHIVTLARLGIGNLHIADFDEFEEHNFNRQAGAYISTLNLRKHEVMAKVANDINPQANVKIFDKITAENVDEFLNGVDVYVDGLDFFVMEARSLVFAKCQQKGIPVVTAAPMAMGSSLVCFKPGSMGFKEYFDFQESDSKQEQLIKLTIGLSPSMMQRHYLVDPTTTDFNPDAERVPSTPMGVKLCGGLATTYVLKLLLNRGKVLCAPHSIHFDAYHNKVKRSWLPFGNRGPIQKFMFSQVKKIVMQQQPPLQFENTDSILMSVLDASRYAPSGDNEQCWRFIVPDRDGNTCTIQGFDTRDSCVYDLQGNASKIALGALQETARIKASEFSAGVTFDDPSPDDETSLMFTMKIESDESITPSPLLPHILTRCVDRRRMGTTALTAVEKQLLEETLPEGFTVKWFETKAQKKAIASMLYKNAYTRVTIPEAHAHHGKIIEWDATFSEDRIPEKALGVNVVMRKMMKQALNSSWQQFEFMSKYLAGTVLPRFLMDYLTARCCSAHFALQYKGEPVSKQDYLDAGAALQRFWLTADKLNLGFQPEYTPIVFGEYLRRGVTFSSNPKALENARNVDDLFKDIMGGEQEAIRATYFGRLGRISRPLSRSIRKPLDDLIVE